MANKRRYLTGMTFGRLKVREHCSDNHEFAVCECECGTVKRVRVCNLISGSVNSCGCIRRERMQEIAKNAEHNIGEICHLNRKYHTNFGVIERTNPDKRNKSGHVGVWFNPKRGKYEAYIGIGNKRISLGAFDAIQDAIDAREAAEDKYYKPLIMAKNAELNYAT